MGKQPGPGGATSLGGPNLYNRKSSCECSGSCYYHDEEGDPVCLSCGQPKPDAPRRLEPKHLFSEVEAQEIIGAYL